MSLERPIPATRRVDLIAVSQRIAESLEHEHPRPFADDQPIAPVIERRGLAARREGAKLREAHLRVKRIRARHAAAEHRVGPPGPQLVDAELERVKRRAARRVDRVGRSPEAQARERRARPAARRETRSAARSSRAVRCGHAQLLVDDTSPRISRVSAEAVSVGKTMLPKTTPTRPRSTRSVRASFHAWRAT